MFLHTNINTQRLHLVSLLLSKWLWICVLKFSQIQKVPFLSNCEKKLSKREMKAAARNILTEKVCKL
jgi:hypothetical protein